METENSHNHHYEEEEKMIRVLYEASHHGCVSTLRSLIQRHPLLLHRINSRTTFTDTPLHISASLGHLEFTKALLAHKPNLATELDSFTSTALHIASAEGHIHIVKELLAAYVQACLVFDKEGKIPLHVAVIRGRLEVVTELVSAKPKSLKILHKGKTVLHLCVTYNHLDILKALVDSSLQICDELLNWRDLDGNTVLHLVVMFKHAERELKSRGYWMASSSTSTTGRNRKARRKVVFVRRPSREEQYEGLRYCYHNLLAPRWTSWSEGNPGRRFYRCRNYYEDGGCGYFQWHDGVFGERENEVIKDLLNDIDKLYEENKQLQKGNACVKCEHLVKESAVNKVQWKFKPALATLCLSWMLLLIMYL